jgi:hypothetical protein
MSKNTRYQPFFSKESDYKENEDHWLKQFQETLQKQSVQSKHVDDSIFNQINSIIGGQKSKYTSVQAAVEDMQQRSGLKDYLEKIKMSENKSSKKVASDNTSQDNTPSVFKKDPKIKNTFDNYIAQTKGNLPIPAIISHIMSIHHMDVSNSKDWDEDNLIRYVSKRNLMAKKDNYINNENINLGVRDNSNASDVDIANTDAFSGLNPVKF